MTREARDTAQRCDVCKRVTLGTCTCSWTAHTGINESVAQTWRLCVRCRGRMLDLLREAAS